MVIGSALLRARQMDAGELLPESRVRQLIDSLGIKVRERLLTPVVMLRLFLIQILHGNTAICHLRQFSGIDFAASSYCQARQKLSLRLMRRVLHWTIEASRGLCKVAMPGPRVIAMDCTTASMPDTPELR